jgi:SH3-like domain-containing protein
LALMAMGSPAFPAGANDGFLPHFVSLRADKVNVRAGPGTRYPISWVFRRAGLPVEAIAEFDDWFKVRYADGDEGWVHRRLLSARRTAVIADKVRVLRRTPAADAAPVVQAEAGVQAQLLTCQDDWCQLQISGKKGWLLREALWGAYPGEDFN